MANQLRAVVTADIKQFTYAMNQVGLSSTAAAGSAIAAFAVMTKAVIRLDKMAIKAAKSYETLGLGLRFAVGNAEKAKEEFETLADLSDRTPFDQKELVKWSIQLRNVTGNIVGTSEQIELMAGALTKAKQSGIGAQSFVNSLGRVVSGFALGAVGLPRFVRTLQKTGGVSMETSKALLALAKEGGNADQAMKILEKDFRKSAVAAGLAAKTAEGLESTLRSVFDRTMADLGTRALEQYKLILVELIEQLIKVRDTKAFKDLGDSLGRLNASIKDMTDDDGLTNMLKVFTVMVDTVNALTMAIRLLKEEVPVIGLPAYVMKKGVNIAKGEFSETMVGSGYKAYAETLGGLAKIPFSNTGDVTTQAQIDAGNASRKNELLQVEVISATGEKVFQ